MSIDIESIADLVEETASAKRPEDIETVLNGLCDMFGLHSFFYSLYSPNGYNHPNLILINGNPEDWRDHYFERNFFPNDPAIKHCVRSIVPVQWSVLTQQLTVSDQQAVMNEARDFKLLDGVCVPTHTPNGDLGILTYTVADESDTAMESLRLAMATSQAFAAYLHESVRRVCLGMVPRDSHLTPRERECLQWAADGKSNWDIGKILNVSEGTVKRHLENCYKKLNVTNKGHAIAKSSLNGDITPIHF